MFELAFGSFLLQRLSRWGLTDVRVFRALVTRAVAWLKKKRFFTEKRARPRARRLSAPGIRARAVIRAFFFDQLITGNPVFQLEKGAPAGAPALGARNSRPGGNPGFLDQFTTGAPAGAPALRNSRPSSMLALSLIHI